MQYIRYFFQTFPRPPPSPLFRSFSAFFFRLPHPILFLAAVERAGEGRRFILKLVCCWMTVVTQTGATSSFFTGNAISQSKGGIGGEEENHFMFSICPFAPSSFGLLLNFFFCRWWCECRPSSFHWLSNGYNIIRGRGLLIVCLLLFFF